MFHDNKFLKSLPIVKSFFGLLLIIFEMLVIPKIAMADKFPAETIQDINNICPVDLPKQINNLISTPELQKAHWGILIKTLQNQIILYDHNSAQLFVPASNIKLLTTAAALIKMGENYQIKTPIYYQVNGSILTHLYLIGKGDPSLTTEQLKIIANRLKFLGIKQIEKITLEDNLSPQNHLNSTWEWEDIYFDYAPAINQLILNQNSVNLILSPQTIGQPLKSTWSDTIAGKQWQIVNQTRTVLSNPIQSISIKGILGKPALILEGELSIQSKPDLTAITIPDPARYFAESFEKVLAEAEIKVNKVEILENIIADLQDKLLLEIISPSMQELITKTNQESNNLYAEALLNLIQEDNNSVDNLKTILQSLGLNPNNYILKDGSGLSRQNLVSPTIFVQLLTAMAQSKLGSSYQESLAIAGEKGTLQNRFENTPIVVKLKGKTGTLSGISALSGYLEIPEFQPLVFSILVNNSEQSSLVLRNAINSIIIMLSKLKQC